MRQRLLRLPAARALLALVVVAAVPLPLPLARMVRRAAAAAPMSAVVAPARALAV